MVAAQPSILCEGVGKTFLIRDERFAWRMMFGLPIDGKKVHALMNVSLLVPKGKIVGILGRNGAGKSTLLRIVAGVSLPNTGLVRLGGDTASLFELGGIGSRFITGREFAKRYLQLQGANRQEVAGLTKEIAEFSELGGYFDRRIVTYSSGMAARLYFSTATARLSEIYLIDEVLSVGDAHFVAKCWTRLRARLAQGASGLLVTHDWSAALKLCEESHVLDGGRITRSGPTDQVIIDYLSLPKPQASGARFLLSGEQEFRLDSGGPVELNVPVEVTRQLDVFFGFSIEHMRIGFGWEVMLLSNFEPLNASVGRYDLILRVPNLPLAPGQYILNLFLSSQAQSISASKDQLELCDARSWTYGNGIKLKVVGRALKSSLRIPVKWELH